MKNLFTLLACVFLALGANAQGTKEKKVLFIGLDGVRSDALRQARTPNMDSLMRTGVFTYTSYHLGITVSGPSWSSMLTGVWQDKHGVTNNNYTGSKFNRYPYFVTRAKEYNPDLRAIQVTSWAPMSDAVYNDGWDVKRKAPTDDAVLALAVNDILTDDELDILFVHVDDCDAIGHGNGFSPLIPVYMRQIEYSDSITGVLVRALKQRANYANEDWLIVMTTDHGGIGTGHGGRTPEETEIWWIASGLPGTIAQNQEITINLNDPNQWQTAPMLVDIAVTALDHLLPSVNPVNELAWDLDGKSWLNYTTAVDQTLFSTDRMQILPNPTTGQLTVVLEDMPSRNLQFSLYDAAGRVVLQDIREAQAGTSYHQFELGALSNGVYTLHVTNGESRLGARVVLSR